MKMHEAFPGNYLKAEMITHPIEVIIDRVEMAEFKDSSKPVVYFRGKQAGVVLSKTRWGQIQDALMADDSNDWSGRRIIMKPSQAMYQGKLVGSIAFEATPQDSQEMAPDDSPF